MTKQYIDRYDLQSMQSAAGKLSCNKTALMLCNRAEIVRNIGNWSHWFGHSGVCDGLELIH